MVTSIASLYFCPGWQIFSLFLQSADKFLLYTANCCGECTLYERNESSLIANHECRYDSDYSRQVMSARYILTAAALFWLAAFLIGAASIPSVTAILPPPG